MQHCVAPWGQCTVRSVITLFTAVFTPAIWHYKYIRLSHKARQTLQLPLVLVVTCGLRLSQHALGEKSMVRSMNCERKWEKRKSDQAKIDKTEVIHCPAFTMKKHKCRQSTSFIVFEYIQNVSIYRSEMFMPRHWPFIENANTGPFSSLS